MQPKKILVTGASGFTGRHFLASARREGCHCVALCQDSNELNLEADECISANLCDPETLKSAIAKVKPDLVVHFAAISFVAHENTSEIYQVNLVGTLNLLDALSQQSTPVEKILIASSANIYGSADNLPIDEATQPRPVNHYAMSKYAMEQAIALYKDLPIIVTRPFNYTGVGQNRVFLIPKIVHAYQQKQSVIELGNLDVSRDFSDVRDVANAYMKLLETDSVASVYNICSGIPTSLMSIIDHLNDIAGYQIQTETNPDFVRADEIKTLYGTNQRLRQAIGEYRQYEIRQTLEWMYEN